MTTLTDDRLVAAVLAVWKNMAPKPGAALREADLLWHWNDVLLLDTTPLTRAIDLAIARGYVRKGQDAGDTALYLTDAGFQQLP